MSDTKGNETRFRDANRRRSDDSGADYQEGRVPSAGRGERHLRLLAVEDNPEMQKLFYHFLSPRWDVYSAYDMKTAMQLAGKIDFDVVLMDINLGEATTPCTSRDAALQIHADCRRDCICVTR